MEVLRCVLRDFMNYGHTPPYPPNAVENSHPVDRINQSSQIKILLYSLVHYHECFYMAK